MHGIRRVLVFCTLTTVLPTMLLIIPLYLRHSFYANVAYVVTESDILEVNDGISTIFCSAHTLQMNGSFNAFQMSHRPEVTQYRKHIRLKKSMNLPDDTLEYWGFYLLKGATVALSVCSRFQGASILVVKGERNLRTCGMLDHNVGKERTSDIFLPEADQQVKITFESPVEEINSKERIIKRNFSESQITNVSYQPTGTETDMSNNTNNDFEKTDGQNTFNVSNKKLEELVHSVETYFQKHQELEDTKDKNITHKLRHAKRRIHRVELEKIKKQKEKEKYEHKLKNLLHRHAIENKYMEKNVYTSNEEDDRLESLKTELDYVQTGNEEEGELNEEDEWELAINGQLSNNRTKRSQEPVQPPSLLDQGILHGGNADRNTSDPDQPSSVSSFETGLLTCYEGAILVAQEFEPSDLCVNVSYLISGKHMQTRHDVPEDGYYYYIFYSDNDYVSNDIHALFDIFKPTFQYENVTKSCINQTECTFTLSMMSSDRVIVEIPTKDGIDHGKDDINLLISTCHPRMGTYVIFPIAVLFLVLSCAFM